MISAESSVAVGQANAALTNLRGGHSEAKFRAAGLRTLHQEAGSTRWIEDTIFGNEKATGHS